MLRILIKNLKRKKLINEMEREIRIKKYHALILEQIKLVQDIGNTCPNAAYSYAELYAAKNIVDSKIKNKDDLDNLFRKYVMNKGLNISFVIS